MSEMVTKRVQARPEELEKVCRRYHVAKLSLFGSALGEDFGPQSDLDVLVEFETGHAPGFEFVSLQRELSELFGYSVDLHTYRSLSRYFRDDVKRESLNLYDGGTSVSPV